MGAADIVALVAYFVGITVLGLIISRKVKSSRDFFMAGHRFGTPMMVMHAFGTGTHTDQAVSVASKTFTSGLSGIWYQWLYLPVTPFYWLISPIFRRIRALTTGDYFECRYDKSVALLFAIVAMMQQVTIIGMMLRAVGAMTEAVTAGKMKFGTSVLVMSVAFVIYGMAGGLMAVILTDFIQGMLTIAFSFILLFPVLNAVGGMAGLYEKIPQMLTLASPKDISIFYIVMLSINGLVGIVAQPHIMGNCAAGRTEFEGRFGMTFGNLLKRICTVAWVLVGLCAVILYPYLTKGTYDQAYGIAARQFLPGIMPGMLGIFLACAIASVMGGADSQMVSASALFTENIYKPFLHKDASERHYVLVGRIVALVVVSAGVVYAFRITTVIEALEAFYQIAALLGIAWFGGLFWRRYNTPAAWTSTLVSFAVMILAKRAFFANWLAQSDILPAAIKGAAPEAAIEYQWQLLFCLSSGLISGILVSLLTKPQPKEKLDKFYDLVATPVKPGEHTDKVCELPPGVEPVKPKKLINLPNWEIYVPAKNTIQGFVAAVICVLVMVAGLILILQIGKPPTPN